MSKFLHDAAAADARSMTIPQRLGGGGGGGGGVNTKMQLSTQCRACGTINISKYVNNFLSTNPTTFILSSLVSEF